ncbi:holdfast anchoring protein HfaA [Woodsholea maritima]|uniref:holdfast anchoring protein HfaA n=1 Tax=Woodsholea maritima TaxID=240237 RepID=UPI00037CCCC6|nr:holdfast anchoring protein HfaA [Woodsholea maritima]
MTTPTSLRLALTSCAIALVSASPALAQQSAAQWGRAYGQAPGQERSAYVNRVARDANGNRIILNGVIQTGVGVQASAQARASGQAYGGVGSGSTLNQSSSLAVGNQLNVNVVGNYNTVIVNAKQINTGDVSAHANTQGGNR